MKIVKVHLSKGALGKNDGCEKAPDAIVETLVNEIWSKEDGSKIVFEIDEAKTDLEGIEGDVFIGGDHSITYSLVKGFAKRNKDFGLVVFDAHPDVYKQHKSVTHQDWIRFLVEEKVVKRDNILLIGLRASDPSEIKWLKDNKIKFFTAADVYESVEDVCKSVERLGKKVRALYLSVDIDVLDPAFAPGTGYREPGGLSTRDLLYFIKMIRKLKSHKASDLVEVNPLMDNKNITVKTAAKIIGELL